MVEKFEMTFVSSRANVFHVPVKQWTKWNEPAKRVFNDVYSSMKQNQSVFKHPKQEKSSREHWKTICWNAAWTAAESVRTYSQ